MLAYTDGLLRVGQHKTEHHLYSKHKGVEIPYNRRLVEQSDTVGRRIAAKGFHTLLHQEPLFGSHRIIILIEQHGSQIGKGNINELLL